MLRYVCALCGKKLIVVMCNIETRRFPKRSDNPASLSLTCGNAALHCHNHVLVNGGRIPIFPIQSFPPSPPYLSFTSRYCWGMGCYPKDFWKAICTNLFTCAKFCHCGKENVRPRDLLAVLRSWTPRGDPWNVPLMQNPEYAISVLHNALKVSLW